MLEDRFYLYRPWIPVVKAIEAKIVGAMDLAEPVLDIGCGNGLFAKYSYKKKIDVGLDYDERVLEEAAKRDVYKTLEAGDAQKLPFPDASFSTIISICAVEHIPDLGKVLTEAHRTLKRGGKFIFTVPSTQFGEFLFGSRCLSLAGLKKQARLYGDEKNKKSGHVHVYKPKKWVRLLEEKKLTTRSISYIFPKEAVFMWSFFHSLPFKILFLPFRAARDLNIKAIDNLLRKILDKLLSGWMAKKSGISENGGYLLIEAFKP